MPNGRIAAYPLMFVTAACLAAACCDDSTAPDDNDPAPPTRLWSARFGDADTQMGNAVAVDASGKMMVAGLFEGAIDCGGAVLTSAGSLDVCVVKPAP